LCKERDIPFALKEEEEALSDERLGGIPRKKKGKSSGKNTKALLLGNSPKGEDARGRPSLRKKVKEKEDCLFPPFWEDTVGGKRRN